MTEQAPADQPDQTDQTNQTAVLFNANCPVCSFEISHYASYADKNALEIRFDDLNSCALQRWNLTADQAARKLYVAHEGKLLSGIPAFRVLWEQMPKYKWLARVAGWPVVLPLSEWLYVRVLAPLIYRWHIARLASKDA
jgi:predicted DCC family thiol-disulfide oxidoreductase YuxK